MHQILHLPRRPIALLQKKRKAWVFKALYSRPSLSRTLLLEQSRRRVEFFAVSAPFTQLLPPRSIAAACTDARETEVLVWAPAVSIAWVMPFALAASHSHRVVTAVPPVATAKVAAAVVSPSTHVAHVSCSVQRVGPSVSWRLSIGVKLSGRGCVGTW